MDAGGYLRIGELSRRVGVSPELLRAWELRYGLLRPKRSRGGFRLYTEADEARVRLMREYQEQGLSAAEAARLAAGWELRTPELLEPGPAAEIERLGEALERFDEGTAHAAFDRLLAAVSLDTLLRDLLLPYLRELGTRWERGEASVAQEHFASNILRGRLLGLARGWGQGAGPRAVLACASGELHDLPLVCFGLALRARGWRVAYLGPDTPAETLADAARSLAPELVVVSAVSRRRFARARNELGAVAEAAPLALAGAGADGALVEAIGARLLADDPVTAAARVAREPAPA
jgi:DNA-binding transcriptional MerR regulator